MPCDRGCQRRAHLHADGQVHSGTVTLLVAQYAVAWTMSHIGRKTVPGTRINLHFSIGVLILLVAAAARLARDPCGAYTARPRVGLIGLHAFAPLYHAMVREDRVHAQDAAGRMVLGRRPRGV